MPLLEFLAHLRHPSRSISIPEALLNSQQHALFHFIFSPTMLGRPHSPHFMEEETDSETRGIWGKNGLKQGVFRHLKRKQRSPVACAGHVVCKKRKEEGHPCECQGPVFSWHYFGCLWKRTRYFSELTVQGSKEFLRVNGPKSRGFWELVWRVWHGLPLPIPFWKGRGQFWGTKKIRSHKRESCSASSINQRTEQ